MPDVTAQVVKSFGIGEEDDRRSRLRRWVDKQTVKKPSVTYNMILLSLTSTVVWAGVTLAFAGRLADHVCDWGDEGLMCLKTPEQRSVQPASSAVGNPSK